MKQTLHQQMRRKMEDKRENRHQKQDEACAARS